MVEEKQILRKKVLKKLLKLSKREVERRSKNVVSKIARLSEYKKTKTIMGYYPLKGEVNILGMIQKVLGKKIVCFPVVNKKTMEMTPYQVYDLKKDFKKGGFGVMEPVVDSKRRVSLGSIDCVLVPAVAFDKNRYRLGRGKGFYDRFIKRLGKSCQKIGVGFDDQLLDSLPVSIPHDQMVDFVITETKKIKQ